MSGSCEVKCTKRNRNTDTVKCIRRIEFRPLPKFIPSGGLALPDFAGLFEV